ncbi:sensor histidine kinase [Paenibacillus mesophilus]|uniref:sensor histidine kinase n=1 Tax=Paenibacillus mesophilus TaxID=2582849 RepID=UPI001EE4DEFE|nr:sensor histidine kinase [Paenibacillus mesophilus]
MGRKSVTFGQKLVFSFLVFVLIPVVLIGYYAYTSTLNSVREQIASNIQGTLRQMKDNVAYTLEDLKRVSELLYYDQKFQQYLRSYEEGWYSYEATTNYLKPKLLGTMKSTGTPIWLSVYVANDTLPEIYYSQDFDVNPLRFKAGQFEMYHLDRIADRPWYMELPDVAAKLDASLYWRQIETDARFHNISLLRRLNDEMRLDQLGFMRITMRIGDLFKTIDAQKIGEASYIAVFNEKRELMHDSGTSSVQIQLQGDTMAANGYFSVEEPVPGIGWSIVAYIPNRMIEKSALKVRNLTLSVCVVSFLFLALLSMVVSRYFSRRVTKIVSVLNAFREGDFQRRTTYSGNDEFAHIFRALNEMGHNTDKLIREVYVSNLQKREAELAALQAQINPHFLYNTLSSISRLAKFGEIGKLHEMVMALAKFYRLTLNEGRIIISIDNEWQQAKAYIDIQKIKHKDRLDFSCRIDENILEFDTIKLILQPFIENVLEHSWYGEDRIHLKVWGYSQDDSIVFQIIDDGIGMPPGKISDIFDPNGIKVGYGIRNVDERIKLQFGHQYGVSICSRRGIGTAVRIVIPKFKGG